MQPTQCGPTSETRRKRCWRVGWFAGWRLVDGWVAVVVNEPDVTGVEPAVAEVLARWRPAEDVDDEALGLVLPLIRDWVMAATPVDGHDTRRLMRAVTGVAMWVYSTTGFSNVGTVLNPDSIETWVMVVNAQRSRVWRHDTRGVLRRVGRAANPNGWPTTPKTAGTNLVAAPYGPSEEQTFKRCAGLQGRQNRAARMWITAASLGAGLTGPEIACGHVDDVIEVAVGRLAVQVGGRNTRLVPIRQKWTDTLAEAVEAVEAVNTASIANVDGGTSNVDGGSGRFISAEGRNAVHQVAQRLTPINGAPLALRRARSTFLVAHMSAGTPMAAIRVIAGPVSANTLDTLLNYTVENLDFDLACLQGLNA